MSAVKRLRFKIIVCAVTFLLVLSAAPIPNKGFSFISPPVQASIQLETISGKIKKGETVSSLLNSYLPAKTIYGLEIKSREVFPLTRIRMGRTYKIKLDNKTFVSFEYEINSDDCLVIKRSEDDFIISKQPITYDIRQEIVSVDIRSSLAEAVQRAGEYNSLTWKLADIFAWDIDFIRDIRSGDSFSAIVDKKYKDGKFCGYSDIRAAFFTNRGITYKAFLHENEKGHKGYFNDKGQSLEKAFLKAPLNYSRISSSFSNRRFHPILKKYRAHPGVDYAAPRNTPIKAVADGVISSIYYSKTTGRQITIRHFSGYETAYFHMNKYATGMKKNKKVVQGEVIGYVGKTGLATGYHLCFRMRKNGRPVNPFDQAPSAGKPVNEKQMDQFSLMAGKYTQQINAHQKLAARSTP